MATVDADIYESEKWLDVRQKKEKIGNEALRERMRLYIHFLSVKGLKTPDADSVRMVFKRTLPVDMLETAQMVKTLSGMVDDEVLKSQLPFMEK